MTDYHGSVVAKFANLDKANKALAICGTRQQNSGLEIRQGSRRGRYSRRRHAGGESG